MIKAVIIDDEERAIQVLTSLLGETGHAIEIVGTARNVPDGVLTINRKRPDVVFLDIEMPDYNGFELLEFFTDVFFEVIFTTAYSQYAIKAFEVSAIDYILKPIQISKLEIALTKLTERMQTAALVPERFQTLKENFKENRIKKIALPVSDGLLFINVNDIVHCEADGAYTNVYLTNNTKILVSKNLKYFEDMLAEHLNFFRSHRSHFININYLKKYSRHEELLFLDNDQNVVLAKNRKQEFEDLIRNN